ncbi:uncharacterized protein LOC127255755 [Andrographis paniculata]|uniref:uncharacterized protein LOC127255755 n=1 Tax=Andrographis paniculata TaxID=175694 RepID=UPI0021E83801|nr:uncharacterized protein LOC127255755 [Andrographis paniculata]
MAIGWVRSSLHCNSKSKALDDVVDHHGRRRRRPNVKLIHHSHSFLDTSSNSHYSSSSSSSSFSYSSSCRSVQNLKDIIVETSTTTASRRRSSKPEHHIPPSKRPNASSKPQPQPAIITRFTGAASSSPSLAELPEGHPSRNVVEIIFRSGWGSGSGSEKAFSGRVEMVFKVQNLTRTLTRFEEYREIVKDRARSAGDRDHSHAHARCIADGHEVLRFYCLGATGGGGVVCCENGGWGMGFQSGKGAGVCTYSGSGVAHDKAGGGCGRRAMLVCRVIAGGGSGTGTTGEEEDVYVFDTRALLPCFLIIYNKF